MKLLRTLTVLLVLPLSAPAARAALLEAFDAGAIAEGPEFTDLNLVQTGLSTGSALGDEREWIADYGGALNVDTEAGTLSLVHDRDPFVEAILRYGQPVSSSTSPPLDADLTADGATQLTLRVARSTPGDSASEVLPAVISITARSGVDSENDVRGGIIVRPIVSEDAYLIQAPFAAFSKHLGEVDFTDLDGLDITFHFQAHATLVIDEIITTTGLAADYNYDGTVNAADYTLWRDRLGQAETLPNESETPGMVTVEDYDAWASNFGNTFDIVDSDGTLSATVAPEPASLALTVLSVGFGALRRRVIPRQSRGLQRRLVKLH